MIKVAFATWGNDEAFIDMLAVDLTSRGAANRPIIANLAGTVASPSSRDR